MDLFALGMHTCTDSILEVFGQLSVLRPNMHVVSNRLIFNETGIAIGHSQPLVHSYNKGKSPEQLATVEPFIEVRVLSCTDCRHLSLPLFRVGLT